MYFLKGVAILTEKILIIEDEQQIARLLQLELQFEGYEAEIALTGMEGLLKYREGNGSWDLILLDIMLPEMNGLEVLERIRKDGTNTPVILLTAKDDVKDKVTGLDLGANDYVTKPFEFEELLARIRTAIRFSSRTVARSAAQTPQQPESTKIIFQNIEIDEATRGVIAQNETVELTKREFDLLLHLVKNAKIVQSREQLLNAVWGFDYYGDTNVVDVYVRYLRQKLPKTAAVLIHTIRGVGYVLKEEAN